MLKAVSANVWIMQNVRQWVPDWQTRPVSQTYSAGTTVQRLADLRCTACCHKLR